MNIVSIVKKSMPLIIISFVLSLTVYVCVQQSMRLSANDPQIEIAQELSSALDNGTSVDSLIPQTKSDLSKSLATFVIVYDTTGKPIASSTQLHKATPSLPSGVFDYTKKNTEDRLTWQPESGIRTAIVVEKYNNGFVVAGKSLKEVELRTDNILKLCIAGFFISSFAVLIYIGFIEKIIKKN